MRDTMNATEAAKVLECSVLKMRHYIRLGIWPFGREISPKKKGGTQSTFEVYPRAMAEYFNLDEGEVWERLAQIRAGNKRRKKKEPT